MTKEKLNPPTCFNCGHRYNEINNDEWLNLCDVNDQKIIIDLGKGGCKHYIHISKIKGEVYAGW